MNKEKKGKMTRRTLIDVLMKCTYILSEPGNKLFISKKYKLCFFGGHKAQEFRGGEGVRTVFSYGP